MYLWSNLSGQRVVRNSVRSCASFARDRFSAVNYYKVLGVEKDCDPKQLRTAYLNKCREFHPDTTPHKDWNPGKLREKFQEVQEAYQILSDASTRKRYDTSEKPLRRYVNTTPFNRFYLITFCRPSGFTTRTWKERDLNRTPYSYYRSQEDPFYYQRLKWWHEERERLAKEAEFIKRAPGRRIQKYELIIGLFMIVMLFEYLRISTINRRIDYQRRKNYTEFSDYPVYRGHRTD